MTKGHKRLREHMKQLENKGIVFNNKYTGVYHYHYHHSISFIIELYYQIYNISYSYYYY